MKKLYLIKEMCGHIYEGMSKGVEYNAKILNLPLWAGWVIGIIFAPIGLVWLLVCILAKRWDIVEEQSDLVDDELET